MPGRAGGTPRAEIALAAVIVGVAAACVVHSLALCWTTRHPLPFADQWGVVVDVERWESGEYRVADLWRQHNEHRVLVPRLLFAVDVFAFRGRNVLIAAAIVVVGALHGALLVWLLRSAAAAPRRWLAAGAAVILLCLFSAVQGENLLIGFPFGFVALTATASFAAMARSVRSEAPGGWLAASLLAAAAASYTLANGLLVWPLLLGLAVWLRAPRRVRIGVALAAVLVMGSYFLDYRRPPRAVGPFEALAQPGRLLAYWALQAGSPFRVLGTPAAGLLGGLGLALAGGLSLRLWRRAGSAQPAAGALACLALFAAGSGAAAALARARFPLEQALESRYTTVALLLWAGVVALLCAWGADRGSGRRLGWAWLVGLALFVAPLAVQQVDASRAYAAHWRRLENASLALIVGVDDVEAIGRIHPRPDKVWHRAEVLRRLRLSVFADPLPAFGEPLAKHYAVTDSERCWGEFVALEPVGTGEGRGARVRGWAWDASERAPPRAVLLVDADGTLVGLARAFLPMPAVAAALGVEPDTPLGWTGYVAGRPRGTLRAYQLRSDGSACWLGDLRAPAGRPETPG